MRIPTWAYLAAGVVAALSILLFLQTKDPMILIFGVVAAAMALGLGALLALAVTAREGGLAGVRVKCSACGALNLENAKFCSQCGRSI